MVDNNPDKDDGEKIDKASEKRPSNEDVYEAVRKLRAINTIYGSGIKHVTKTPEQLLELADSLDYDDFFKTWEQTIHKRPWQFSFHCDFPIEEKSNLVVLIRPCEETRNEMECLSMKEYKYGYELPLLLLNEQATVDQARRLNSILPTISMIYNLPDQPKHASLRGALGFLLSACLRSRSAFYTAVKATPPLALSSVSRAFNDESLLDRPHPILIQAVQRLDPDSREMVELVAHADSPLMTVDDLIHLWDTNSPHLFKTYGHNDKQGNGYWLFHYLPPAWIDWGLWKEMVLENEPHFDIPKVGIEYDIAKVIKPHHEELREIEKTGGGSLHIGSDRNIFRKEGDNWIVRFDGKRRILKDLKGMGYILLMLQYPEKPFHVNDILKAVGQIAPGSASTSPPEAIYTDLEISSGIRSEPVIDKKTLVAARKEIARLRQKATEAELNGLDENAEQLRSNAHTIDQYLKRATKPGGGTRQIDQDLERARQLVGNNIQTTLRNIQENHASLWRHLKTSLKLGKECVYFPDKEIEWDF